MRIGLVVGRSAEEAENDTGGSPIVVLMTVGAERGPVVINVEQTDFPVTRRVEIHSAPYFIRDAVGRSGVAADAANNSVRARSARKGFDKGSGAPAAQPAVKVTRTEMISVKDVLGAADRDSTVAAVRNELQPWLEIPGN